MVEHAEHVVQILPDRIQNLITTKNFVSLQKMCVADRVVPAVATLGAPLD